MNESVIVKIMNIFCKDKKRRINRYEIELLQSQASVERELLGNSAVRKLDIGVQILDIRY